MKRGLKIRGKSGQFYLVAAVVIVGAIIGISAVSNYSKKEESPGINDLSEEIQIESAKTLDYGIKNGLTQPQMNQLMKNFTSYYVNYEGRSQKSLYFIFGTRSNITVSGYQEEGKTILVKSGTSQATITTQPGDFTGSLDPQENGLTFDIDGNSYVFDLSPAENFYFVTTQNVGGGEYVVTG